MSVIARKKPSFLNAIKWSYISVLGEKGFSGFFNFLLAALLDPKDFGIVMIVWLYVSFANLLLDQGLVCALIQKKDLDREHVDAVFWMDVVLGIVLVGLSMLGAHWWARVNHAPEIASLIDVLSIIIPIEALSVVPRALIQRDMDFRSLSIRANACVLLGGIIGVGLAYKGFGAWSLIWQQIISAATSLPLLWTFCPWRPRLRFSWRHLRSLLGFSTSNFAAQLAMTTEAQMAPLLLGLFSGPVAVGLYRLADRISYLVIVAATSSVQIVSLPEFSRVQGSASELRQSVLTCIRFSSTLTLPALVGLAMVARPLMAVIGPQWAPAADVLIILCLLDCALIFSYFTGPLLQAIGKPHQLALLEWGRTCVGAVLFLATGFAVRHAPMQWQLLGITLSRFVLGTAVVTPVFLVVILRLARISWRQFVAEIAPSTVASLCSAAAVFGLDWLLAEASPRPVILLAASVVVGGVAGLAVLLALDPQLRGMVRSRRRSFGLRSGAP